MAGPRRRAAVARLVENRRPDMVVRAVPGGWTVTSRTGAGTVCRTVTALLAATTPEPDRPEVLQMIVEAGHSET